MLFVLLLLFLSIASSVVVLSNKNIEIDFADAADGFGIVSISDAAHQTSFTAPPSYLWTIVYVGTNGAINFNSLSPAKAKNYTLTTNGDGSQLLTLNWNGIAMDTSATPPMLDVALYVSLGANDSNVQITPSTHVAPGAAPVGLWSCRVIIPFTLATDGNDILFWPDSFGRGYQNPAVSAKSLDTGLYPSGSISFQYMAYYTSANQGLYVGAHDPTGEIKEFYFSLSTDNSVGFLEIQSYPNQMGQSSMTDWKCAWPISIAVFNGDWWTASQIYRAAMLPIASWTQKGDLWTRKSIPQWFIQTSMWFNTGWQPLDIFNTTQGDPDVVLSEFQTIRPLFPDLTLALHWYVFSEDIVFDQGYPEYFPVKPGFGDAVTQLQSMDVHVCPYINGRIFDINTDMWRNDNAILYAAKQSGQSVDSTNLSPYTETYGSGATFNVMCPATNYWDNVIAQTVDNLTNIYDCHGVYIDQIGAAHSDLCFDPTHNHGVGGGSFWITGYRNMLSQAKQGMSLNGILVTEDNAEPFMDNIDGYLSLTAYHPPITGSMFLLPAFPAIYGGYYTSFGQEFYQSDLNGGNTDVFTVKVALMFTLGTQIGWFSLSGTTDDPPMAYYPLFTDPQYKPEVDFVNLICQYRQVAYNYLTYGRLFPAPTLTISSMPRINGFSWNPVYKDGKKYDRVKILTDYDGVLSSVWKNDYLNSMGVFITNPSSQNVTLSATLDMTLYQFSNDPAANPYVLSQVMTNGQEKILQQFTTQTVTYPTTTFGPRSVVYLKVSVAA